MRRISHLLVLPIAVLLFISCKQTSKEDLNDKVWMIIQPELELNRSTTARIYFSSKPEAGSIKISQIAANDDYDLDPKHIEENLESDGTNLYYDIEFTAGKLGNSNLPVIEAVISGQRYKSKQISINVIQKQIVDSNAIRLVFSTDKESYLKNDTISLSLSEYSKFYQRAKFTPAELVKKGAPEALFAIIEDGNVDYKVGIVGFKDFINTNFKASHFTWNVNDINRRMAKLKNDIYIKTEIFSIKLVAKNNGRFKVNNSRFNYKIYPYSEAFKEEILSEKEVLTTNNRWDLASNTEEIVVD